MTYKKLMIPTNVITFEDIYSFFLENPTDKVYKNEHYVWCHLREQTLYVKLSKGNPSFIETSTSVWEVNNTSCRNSRSLLRKFRQVRIVPILTV